MRYTEFTIEGRNAVIEAFRSGKTIDKLFILDGCQDGPVMTIRREAAKSGCLIKYVPRERLDQMSETGKHQGVIAYAAAYAYAEVEDMLDRAREKGEPPFLFLLDNIEDPHNLGAIIRTANLAGAHGVIIPKNRGEGLRRRAQLHARGESDQSGTDDRGIKEERAVVCLCGYEGHTDVRAGPERTDRHGDR